VRRRKERITDANQFRPLIATSGCKTAERRVDRPGYADLLEEQGRLLESMEQHLLASGRSLWQMSGNDNLGLAYATHRRVVVVGKVVIDLGLSSAACRAPVPHSGEGVFVARDQAGTWTVCTSGGASTWRLAVTRRGG
jgi:hypothetical protein